ncbi:MAG TPA: DUF3153 domain-containing protein [Cyanobacteria bacterium UBA11149]|nr:DUF3153 domain-containing protein [Cyanobacteria bacterium UBA11367]HBE58985.1 DUF3153 domain-containing protein [Cyanobacteria bacterium UBA11366]HBK63021.1 DUF3153 domain-containing protein [Cyanobacteria bacterium UBA11166]HBR76760.1 DUF3153 domain-containing protein [Cyanobacteria bacterium UBA11159]HBS70378.1 DUF3153 domain-containing protein [Cyanobacteria bacterium UBA11153]HBW89205.1 DUF3153 domain-containing protein [Cyanobacteria bacterium UBA11149]HCA97154.1 DUF3153 domain-conta
MMGRFRLLWAILLVSLLLSGCVKYDMTVSFNSENSGAIVQKIELGEQMASFSQDRVAAWFKGIEKKAKKINGRIKRLSSQTVLVTIPFSGGPELLTKYNEFFQPDGQETSLSQMGDTVLPNIESKLNLKQLNFFVVQRNQLSYELDLRSLALISSDGQAIVSPGSLLDLHFSLQTPWGAKLPTAGVNSVTPEISDRGRKLLWNLDPGEFNHLEAVFWVPSPVGIGTIAIIAIVLVGFYIKYQSFPWSRSKADVILSERLEAEA